MSDIESQNPLLFNQIQNKNHQQILDILVAEIKKSKTSAFSEFNFDKHVETLQLSMDYSSYNTITV